jgi:hypothetical protein
MRKQERRRSVWNELSHAASTQNQAKRGESSAKTLRHGKTVRSEPLAEVQRALLVVLVLHAPHPEAGGLLLSKLGKHCKSVGEIMRRSFVLDMRD